MRKISYIIWSAIILIIFNTLHFSNAKILEEGQPVLVKLAPVDPRSIMQGDYMRLSFTNPAANTLCPEPREYCNLELVYKLDKEGIASHNRIYNGGTLGEDEFVLKAVVKRFELPRITLKPNSFLFEEGQGSAYSKARYAVFKFKGHKRYLLSDLADENKNIINPLRQ